MNRKTIYTVILAAICVFASREAFSQEQQFPLDETLRFKLNYGWFSLGEAIVTIDDSLHYSEGEPFYKTSVIARTIGLFSWLAGIEDFFMGYISAKNYKPSYTEKRMRQRKENFDQWSAFDYENMKVYARSVDHLNDEQQKKWEVDLTENTYDILGTYLFLRSRNWSGYNVGDSILIKTFFETKLYDFGMEYAGEEVIKFEGNKIQTSKFYILFPVSKTFPKQKAVTVWVTRRNRMTIPLIIEAHMKIGKVVCELQSYSAAGKDRTGLFKK